MAEQAYQFVRDRILRGSIPLGAVISRRQLAEQLNMSPVPIAEAVQRLESEGLVERRPRVGTRVRIPTREEIRGRFEVREALECQVARLCTERATLEERFDLRRSADHLDALFTQAVSADADHDFTFAVQQYHLEFHMQIAACAHSPVLFEAIEKSHALVFNWLYNVASGRQGLPPGFHSALTEVLIGSDPMRSEEAMRNHVRHGLDGVIRAVEVSSVANWRAKRLS
jgi:DNA-binding GntR family transcriptional regulator